MATFETLLRVWGRKTRTDWVEITGVTRRDKHLKQITIGLPVPALPPSPSDLKPQQPSGP